MLSSTSYPVDTLLKKLVEKLNGDDEGANELRRDALLLFDEPPGSAFGVDLLKTQENSEICVNIIFC